MNVLEKMTKPFQRQPDTEEAIHGSPPEAANDDPAVKARRRRIVLLGGAIALAAAVGIYIMSHVIGAEENRTPPVDQTQVVSVVPLAAHAFTPHVALLGEVRPKRDIHVFATASGVRVLQLL